VNVSEVTGENMCLELGRLVLGVFLEKETWLLGTRISRDVCENKELSHS
jgi:hypothetical protein